jgi:ADP-ribose diphosphatase
VQFSSLPDQRDDWETISRQIDLELDHLAVATEEVRTPRSRRVRRWTVVHRKAAVVIAPMTADGKLVLIRQERIPIRTDIWEVPAGQIDQPGAPDTSVLEDVGLRELREETGYGLAPNGKLLPLGYFFSSPGFTDEHGYFFLALNVQPAAGGPAHQESESILECREFAPAEIVRMIANNEIRDANTLSICARLSARGFFSLQP